MPARERTDRYDAGYASAIRKLARPLESVLIMSACRKVISASGIDSGRIRANGNLATNDINWEEPYWRNSGT